jgi:hypothetical protein
MDHQSYNQPQGPPFGPPAAPVNNQITPPLKTKKSPAAATAIILAVLALVATGGAFAADSSKAPKTDTAKVSSLENRVKLLEEADQYSEKQVDKTRYQAVFLSNGQVYFGKITEFTKDTLKLVDIYYLRTGSIDKNGNPTTADASLTKLGSELHAPDDVMFIERKNLTFWENLKTDGQVTKAIGEYQKTHK